MAIAFAREGADVLISYLDEHEDAKRDPALGRGGRPAGGAGAPATSPTPRTAARSIDTGGAEFGRIDVLVSNAAFQMTHETIEEIPDEEWDRTIAINLSARCST